MQSKEDMIPLIQRARDSGDYLEVELEYGKVIVDLIIKEDDWENLPFLRCRVAMGSSDIMAP